MLLRVPVNGAVMVEEARSLIDGARDERQSGYLHTDIRGSTLARADWSEQMSLPFEEAEYGAWGETLSVSELDAPTHQFVGFEPDPATGWYFMGARVYDPELRRWLSPDPLLLAAPDINSVNGDELNLYTYSKNNPITFTDPEGLLANCGVGCEDEIDYGLKTGTIELGGKGIAMAAKGLFKLVGKAARLLKSAKNSNAADNTVKVTTSLENAHKTAKAGQEISQFSREQLKWKSALYSKNITLKNLGRPGKRRGVRELQGDANDARKVFDRLRNGNVVTEAKGGVFVAKGGKGGHITLRETLKFGPPTVDVHGVEDGVRKLKFIGESKW